MTPRIQIFRSHVVIRSLTQPGDKLLEVDEAILVVAVQQTEEACGQDGRVRPAHPRPQRPEELAELARVDAVLLQVGQAGVVAVGRRRAAGPPVAAHDVLGLEEEEPSGGETDSPVSHRIRLSFSQRSGGRRQ